MSVGMAAFWALVAWVIVALARTGRADESNGSTRPDDVLASRLARGEISTDEYVQARRLIDRHSGQSEARNTTEVV
jgi:uncharacterized membrane protein